MISTNEGSHVYRKSGGHTGTHFSNDVGLRAAANAGSRDSPSRFDVLDERAKTIEEISTQTGASKGGLHALIFAVNMRVNTDEGDTFTLA